MLDAIPDNEQLEAMLDKQAYLAWTTVTDFIALHYDTTAYWNTGGKAGIYECKFRKGSKTLCSLYVRQHQFGFMVIFGKNERAQFESEQQQFSAAIRTVYAATKTYHDGKWLMFEVLDDTLVPQLLKLLAIKRKPSKSVCV
jgi:hypothetical protein